MNNATAVNVKMNTRKMMEIRALNDVIDSLKKEISRLDFLIEMSHKLDERLYSSILNRREMSEIIIAYLDSTMSTKNFIQGGVSALLELDRSSHLSDSTIHDIINRVMEEVLNPFHKSLNYKRDLYESYINKIIQHRDYNPAGARQIAIMALRKLAADGKLDNYEIDTLINLHLQ